MYLGLTGFGTPATAKKQQPAYGATPAPPARPAAQQRQSNEVGDASSFVVNGCTDPVVGPTVRGQFMLNGLNHGKPVYQRQGQANGFNVCVFFWDQRDGPEQSGWWFAPAIGSDQVWAYSPSQSATPPLAGWKVPISGPVDHSMRLNPAGRQQMSHHQQQQRAMQQKQQYQQQQHAEKERYLEAQKERMELQKKTAEENARKRAEEAKVAAVEKNASSLVQAAMNKLNLATPDTYEEATANLNATVANEIEKCGSKAEGMRKAVENSLKAAETRVKQALERRKAEEESKEKAQALLAELSQLADAAEAASASLTESAQDLTGSEVKIESENDLSSTMSIIGERTTETREKLDTCSAFLKANQAAIHKGIPPPKHGKKANKEKETEAEAEEELSLGKLTVKINKLKQAMDKVTKDSKSTETMVIKQVKANSKKNKFKTVFTKYDKDMDGMLNGKEIQAYAKGEYGLAVTQESMDLIFSAIVGAAKGVSLEKFHTLKVMVGIAREAVKDKERRAIREKREQELAVEKAKFQEEFDAAQKLAAEADAATEKADKEAVPLRGKSFRQMKVLDALELLAKVDEAVKEARAKAAEASKDATTLRAGSEGKTDRLRDFVDLDAQAQRLGGRCKKTSAELNKLEEFLKWTRKDAQGKDNAQLEAQRYTAIGAIKKYMHENAVTAEKLFEEFDSDKDGQLSRDDFLHLLAKPAELEQVEAKKTLLTTESTVERLLAYLNQEGDGDKMSKDLFVQLTRRIMRVVKEVAITDDFGIKESNTIRRLEMNEDLLVLEGPKKEEATDVLRVRITALKDNKEGWVTIEGNKGTPFLQDGGGVYKVVKETILTPDFTLGDAASDALTHKLKPGDRVEVRVFPKLEEVSGLTRMRCRVKAAGGPPGWATVLGNTGTVFLEANSQ
eukprot:TRINITY_DN651_c0_g1_i1.p1 TRINITY_DN651_c0_g1~~TRINITY_DN651_c0_g1_i1.p1  ORF type:complete len:907 (-),score=340.16 TRINITY_DN651_c0_g1_i1:154-2874(-)